MAALQRCYRKLHLRINEAKSAVASVWGRKFLGYCFWSAPHGVVRQAVAAEAVQRHKQRIRQITRRQTGRSMKRIAEDLQAYVPGWQAYFRLAQTPRVWRELDEWTRHNSAIALNRVMPIAYFDRSGAPRLC
jgi:RNA-directed DNA polymerase